MTPTYRMMWDDDAKLSPISISLWRRCKTGLLGSNILSLLHPDSPAKPHSSLTNCCNKSAFNSIFIRNMRLLGLIPAVEVNYVWFMVSFFSFQSVGLFLSIHSYMTIILHILWLSHSRRLPSTHYSSNAFGDK